MAGTFLKPLKASQTLICSIWHQCAMYHSLGYPMHGTGTSQTATWILPGTSKFSTSSGHFQIISNLIPGGFWQVKEGN